MSEIISEVGTDRKAGATEPASSEGNAGSELTASAIADRLPWDRYDDEALIRWGSDGGAIPEDATGS